MTEEKEKNTRCKYKTWGKHKEQTVRQSRKNKNYVVIRKGDREVGIRKNEIDSLIISLLQMRNCK